MKLPHTYTVQVVNVLIQITFHKPSFLTLPYQSFAEMTSLSVDGFRAKSSRQIDYYIDVVEQLGFKTYQPKDSEDTYINFYKKNGPNRYFLYHHASLYHFHLLLRKVLVEEIIHQGGMILHASACNVENGAVIFLAPSGGGKSTIIHELKDAYPSLADDLVVLLPKNKEWHLYQIPNLEKANWIVYGNNNYPVHGMYFLKKSTQEDIKKLENPAEIYSKLLRQVILRKKQNTREEMAPIPSLCTSVPFYILDYKKHSSSLKDLILYRQ